MTPCMGGWCGLREKCPHFTSAQRNPSERLCITGQDGWQMVENKAGYSSRKFVFWEKDVDVTHLERHEAEA